MLSMYPEESMKLAGDLISLLTIFGCIGFVLVTTFCVCAILWYVNRPSRDDDGNEEDRIRRRRRLDLD